MKNTALWLNRIAPILIGIIIILGTTMVFSSFSYSYNNSKSVILELGFSLIVGWGLLTIPSRDFRNSGTSKIVQAVGLYLVVLIAATVHSIDRTASWYSHMERGVGTFFVLVIAIGAAFAVLLAQRTAGIRKTILYPLAISGAIIGLSVILGETGFNSIHAEVLGDSSGGGGLTGNSSFAGTFLLLCFFIIGYLFFTRTKQKGTTFEKIALILFAILTVCNPIFIRYSTFTNGFQGIIASIGDARGATVSLVLGIVVALGVYLSFSTGLWKRWLGRVLGGGVIIGTAIVLVLLLLANDIGASFFVKNETSARFIYWDMALQGIHDHPVLGTGPETFRYVHDTYFNPDLMRKSFSSEVYADKPHNAFLETVMGTGIVGGLSYLLLLGTTVWTLWKLGKRPQHRVLVATLSGLLFAYLLNNVILFDIAVSYLIFFIVLFWVAFQNLEDRRLLGSPQEKLSLRSVILRSVLACIVIGVVFGTVIPEIKKIKLVLVEMYAPLRDRATLYQHTESASPFGSGITIAQRADVYTQNYINHSTEVSASSPQSKKLILADIDAISNALQMSLKKYPPSSQAYVDLAQVEIITISALGDTDPALSNNMIEDGQAILKLSPRNPQGYWTIGQAYAFQGKFADALTAFRAALAIDPHVPESHREIMILAQVMGDKKLYAQATADYERDIVQADR